MCLTVGSQSLLNLSLLKTNLMKPRKLLNSELFETKSVTTQMKALDEYFLMVVFTLLLNRCLIWTDKHGSENYHHYLTAEKSDSA